MLDCETMASSSPGLSGLESVVMPPRAATSGSMLASPPGTSGSLPVGALGASGSRSWLSQSSARSDSAISESSRGWARATLTQGMERQQEPLLHPICSSDDSCFSLECVSRQLWASALMPDAGSSPRCSVKQDETASIAVRRLMAVCCHRAALAGDPAAPALLSGRSLLT